MMFMVDEMPQLNKLGPSLAALEILGEELVTHFPSYKAALSSEEGRQFIDRAQRFYGEYFIRECGGEWGLLVTTALMPRTLQFACRIPTNPTSDH